MRLFNNKKNEPDVTFKVSLCDMHKNVFSVNVTPPKTKRIPNNIVMKPREEVVNGATVTVVTPTNKIPTQVAGIYQELYTEVPVETKPKIVISNELVKRNLVSISNCPNCSVVIG